MTTVQISLPTILTTHAAARMSQRGVALHELQAAAADAVVTRQAGDRLQVRGRNDITYLSDLTGAVVITVLPRGAAPVPAARPHAGRSRHLANRQGPKNRDDRTRPRR